MGQELETRAHVNGKPRQGKVLLETDFVLFRAPEVRVRVPIVEVSSAEVHGGWLRLVWGPQALELELGAGAAAWAERILTPRSLLDKLGVAAGLRVSLVGLEDPGLIETIEGRGAEVVTGRTVRGSDLILFRADSVQELGRLESLKASLVPNGGIWVVSPKGDPSIRDVDVMAAAKAAGLVDVKVARWSDRLTALKLVIPRANR